MAEYAEQKKYLGQPVSLSTMMERARQLDSDMPRTEEGHLALFINLANPDFVKEFRRTIIKVTS